MQRLARLDRRLEDGAGLHLDDLGIAHEQPRAALAEHRVELAERGDAAAQLATLTPMLGGDLADELLAMRQELVQRRIEQADGHRQPRHDLEQLDEILALRRQQLGERRAAPFRILGEDHLAHGEDALLLEEHVLGAAEPDAFGAEGARLARIGRRIGIGAHLQAAEAVGPLHQGVEVVRQLGLAHGHAALDDLAGRAVDGDHVALVQKRGADRTSVSRSRSMTTAEAPTTQGRPMPRATTAAWLVMPPRVVRMPTAACMPCTSSGEVSTRARITVWPCALRCTASSASNTSSPEAAPGRGGQSLGQHRLLGLGVERRMEQLVELAGIDAPHRLLAGDQALFGHVDGDLQRGLRRALARAGLQHEELAFLHGELDVLDVAEMGFELGAGAFELGEHVGHQPFERRLARVRSRGARPRSKAAACASPPPRPRLGH